MPGVLTPTAAVRHYKDLPGPRPLPLIGNLHQVKDRLAFHQTLEDGIAEFGPMYRFGLGRFPAVVIGDQGVMMSLMRQRPDNIRRDERLSRLIDEVIQVTGLFTAEGEDWRRQRKLVTRTLTPDVVRKFHPTLVKMSERLVRRWRDSLLHQRQPEILLDLKALALDVTVAIAMGEDINTLESANNPLQRDIHFLFKRVGQRLVTPVDYWRWVRLPVDRATDAAAARMCTAVQGFIDRTRARLANESELRARPSNLMEALVIARDEPASGVTDAALVGTALTMVFAGEDTTSSTLGWLLNQIAAHPEVAARLALEADAVFGGQAQLHDASALERLEYTEAVVHESMRLKPAAPMVGLETLKEVTVGDVIIPPGMRLMLMMRVPALRADRFDDPLSFRPERWLGHSDATSEPQRRMTPFGGGPRMCPGRYLALADIKLFLATLMRNFTVTPMPGAAPVREEITFTMNPSAVPVVLRSRAG